MHQRRKPTLSVGAGVWGNPAQTSDFGASPPRASLGVRKLATAQVDTRVVTTRRAIKVQRQSIFRHLENRRKKKRKCVL
jgi:hypothetical protein